MERTGMFLPRLSGSRPPPAEARRPLPAPRGPAIVLALLVAMVGAGFAARAYTVRHLPLAAIGPVDVLTITPEDLAAARGILPAVLETPAVPPEPGAPPGR